MANITDVRTNDTPQRAYEWEVELLGSSSAGNIPILTQRAETVTIAEMSIDTIEINFKNSKTIHAGRDASPHSMTVSFYDGEDHALRQYFINWYNAIRSPDGGGVDRSQYAGELVVRLYASDSQTVTATYRATKVFPTSVGEMALSYADSEHAKFDVTFSFDECQPE